MRVAVLSLCRDRVEYSMHCFGVLHQFAGCEYDHLVLDQGSQDDTPRWLLNGTFHEVHLLKENIGISKGFNFLLERCASQGYDVVVTFDNDCEVVMPGTLDVVARIAAGGEWIVSPTVQGLNNPPQPGPAVEYMGERIGPYHAIGGIFRAMPGEFAKSFRFNESNPLWGYDEIDVGRAAVDRGLQMGYLLDWHVNHYQTTSGQHAQFPEYFARTLAEGKPSL